VNGETIGTVYIQRLDEVVPGQPSRYLVEVEYKGELRKTEVEHDYDDGALVLISKALAAVNTQPPRCRAISGSRRCTLASDHPEGPWFPGENGHIYDEPSPVEEVLSRPRGSCSHGIPWNDMPLSHYAMEHKTDHP
jgi:hypothetical protein